MGKKKESVEIWEVMPHPLAPKRQYNEHTLWDKALEYFTFNSENPLQEQKVFGTGYKTTINKMRAMTDMAFCLFAGISRETFYKWQRGEECNPEMELVAKHIAGCIYKQKFEGASADMLNANIISRELGLADKQRIDTTINLSDKDVTFE